MYCDSLGKSYPRIYEAKDWKKQQDQEYEREDSWFWGVFTICPWTSQASNGSPKRFWRWRCASHFSNPKTFSITCFRTEPEINTLRPLFTNKRPRGHNADAFFKVCNDYHSSLCKEWGPYTKLRENVEWLFLLKEKIKHRLLWLFFE